MVYHYLSWTVGEYFSDTFIGRLGIYGVSIFYVLSGLTLYHVYFEKMNPSKEDTLSFFKKRVFRLFPLLWLVTFISILISRQLPDITNLFLNLTGLFGFVKWDEFFALGAWSIGNELVFYAFFPFFILFIKRFKPIMVLITLAILGIYIYFAFVKLNPQLTLDEQWKNYINPLNQVFLFLAGFLIGFFLNHVKIKNRNLFTLLILGITLFTFYPVTGDVINLVTGVNRLLFTFCCLLICFCFYKMTFKFPMFIHKPLTLLGEASYSVYLLHPIIWVVTGITIRFLSKHLMEVPKTINVILSILFTLIISYYVYQYFEKYFVKLGQRNKSTHP